MTTVKGLYGERDDGGVTSNYGVDYIVHFKVPPKERAEAEASFVQLIEAFTRVGLATTVRPGKSDSLLIFTKVASQDLLAQQVYRARLADWLHGIRSSPPDADAVASLRDEPITEAERSRLVYLMITKPQNDGGAGITPGNGRWKYVESVFPLHNQEFNKAWVQKWSKKYILDQEDIDEIRDKFGESVAFYFAFVQAYFRFLVFPAAAGFAAWTFLGQFSWFYMLVNCLWSVVFFEYWKKKEVDMAVRWGVRGVSAIQHSRPEFKWEYEAEDPVTGELVKVYDPLKRLKTQLLQIPFGIAGTLLLGGLVVACNSLEVFINEVYTGIGKQYLTFLPTVILCVCMPVMLQFLMSAAKTLTAWENYHNVDAYDAALVQKQFVLNFITSYMPLLFTAFVYIPFGEVLVPFLNFWHKTAQAVTFSEKPLPTKNFTISPDRISKQMFYFTVTAQIINFATEVVVPYVKRQAVAKAREMSSTHKQQVQDHEEEASFLERVRNDCELEVYSVSGDYREMVIQFGYLSLFSVTWPLTAVCFLINNWVELRSDAIKIAVSSRRPIPWRSDSIGPWLTALGFISWFGSVTSSAIVALCSGARNSDRGSAANTTAWGVLASVLFVEHFYFIAQVAVRFIMSQFDSPGLQKERKERFLMKKQMLEKHLGQSMADSATAPGVEFGDKITRQALEEEARQTSIRGHGSPEETFWQRQRGMQDTIIIGRKMIQQGTGEAEKDNAPSPSPRA